VNLDVSYDNCGTCATSCINNQVCDDGECTCLPEQTDCDGTCADLEQDEKHCGDCDTECISNKICDDGECTCLPEQTDCDGTCADLTSDKAHCGSCGTACGNTELCVNGRCGGRACPTGQFCTDGTCLRSPCDGLCEPAEAVTASADGFRVEPLGTGARCFEVRRYAPMSTQPRIVCWEFDASRTLRVNGATTPCIPDAGHPLGKPRADGYCVQIGPGGADFAGFLFPTR
jgi:hypothetical protein